MLRMSFLPIAAAFALSLSMPADAQRRSAPVTQGTTTSELAATISDLRVANAELGARLTGVEADKAALNGKVETLEFLLSQSRDQINDMQADDAEIGRLISQLEKTLQDQNGKIRTLEAKVESLQAEHTASNMQSLTSTSNGTTAPPTASDSRVVRRTITTSDGRTIEMEPLPPQPQSTRPTQAQPATINGAGPTRIVRRPASEIENTANQTTAATTTRTAPNTSQNSITVAGARSVTTQAPTNQGSLGTIPASALPGEAGPLFAEAKSRLLDFDYAGAEIAFGAFLNQFGDDPQAGEAQYWLAEVLHQQKEYAEAGKAYTTMIRSYPDDQRAPEALAKLARSMRLVGDTDQACNALNLLPNRYPDASGVTKALAARERTQSGCDS